ncbi:MAG TPA: hypothetical protein VNT31_15760 [Nocardioides sp.]|nr:hypothetical protein [Nocardioides sp.]
MSLDTKVEGSPAAVTAAANWLRDTLKDKVGKASDEQQDARNHAQGAWEGETYSSYRNVSGDILKASDKHEERVGRAATALDDYAAKLKRLEDDMTSIRTRATEGGLSVSGTVIEQPAAAPTTPYEVGSPEEAAYNTAVTRIELWNALVEDAAADYQTFVDWVDSNMPADVADARKKDASDTLFDSITALFPNFASGSGAGLAGLALLNKSKDYKADAAEFRRRTRRSGNPAVRNRLSTPEGRAQLDDLLKKADLFGRGARFLGGPAGILIDVGFGIYEGTQTGDWTRVAVTTGTSIAVGVGVGLLVTAGVVTAPAWAVVLAGGALAAGASWLAGTVYDNWDDITDWTSDRWDDATDAIGDAWDAVTPW